MGTGGRHGVEVRNLGSRRAAWRSPGDVEVGREGRRADGCRRRSLPPTPAPALGRSCSERRRPRQHQWDHRERVAHRRRDGAPDGRHRAGRRGRDRGGRRLRQPTENETATVPPPPPPAPPTPPPAAAPRPPAAAAPRPPAAAAAAAPPAAVGRVRHPHDRGGGDPLPSGEHRAQAARSVAASAERARKALTGLGSEPWGTRPQICLVDPYPDPDRPGEVVASGTVVDTERAEVWMVVTPESPPEPLERPLALVFGAALPAAADLGILLEGYGLHVGGAPDPDPELRAVSLPPLDQAEGEMRSLMALSFVRSLIERGGAAELLRLFGSAQPGRVDAAARELYGFAVAGLEEAWLQKLAAGPPDVRTGQFIRLAGRYLRPYLGREAEMFVYALFALAFTVVFPFASAGCSTRPYRAASSLRSCRSSSCSVSRSWSRSWQACAAPTSVPMSAAPWSVTCARRCSLGCRTCRRGGTTAGRRARSFPGSSTMSVSSKLASPRPSERDRSRSSLSSCPPSSC